MLGAGLDVVRSQLILLSQLLIGRCSPDLAISALIGSGTVVARGGARHSDVTVDFVADDISQLIRQASIGKTAIVFITDEIMEHACIV